MNSTDRNFLRKTAHALKPVVMVGRNGVNESVIAAVDEALTAHELIKIKFIDYKGLKGELSQQLTEKTESEMVALIGNIVILFRQNRDPKMRKIDIRLH